MKQWLVTWFKAARAPFLIVSFLPSVLGGIMAYARGSFDWAIFLLATLGIVMAHSAGDFVDDYFDFQKGNLGNKVQQFHDSPLIDGKVSLKQVLTATFLCLAVAFGCGVYIYIRTGLPVIYMTLTGLVAVFFYTSPPLRLNYRGLGETVLFFAFGPLIVVGVYYVLTLTITWEPILISLMPGFFTMNVGMVSNTFDYHDDIKSGKKTLSVRYGQATSVKIIGTSAFIAYLAIILGVLFQQLSVWTLLALLTIPMAVKSLHHVRQYGDVNHYTPAMSGMIGLSSFATIILIAAYILEALL